MTLQEGINGRRNWQLQGGASRKRPKAEESYNEQKMRWWAESVIVKAAEKRP